MCLLAGEHCLSVRTAKMLAMQLNLLGAPHTIEISEESSITSVHTGVELRQVTFEAMTSAEQTDEFVAELDAAQGNDAALEADDGSKWLVTNRSWMYSDDGPRTFTVTIRQGERLQAERIELPEGLTLTPAE